MIDEHKTAFKGWTIPGPRPPGGIAPEPEETLDAIAGHWRIFQYRSGHRFSTDDVVCAWYASQWAPRVERYCDLGSGIGSVALNVAWRLPGCRVVTLEAQAQSHRLQQKSIRYNGVEDRFTALLGDLRDVGPLLPLGPFDLVTGSPPYWAVGDTTAPVHTQAQGARLETRGSVADYARAARAVLAPGGLFVCVHQASQDERVREAIAEAGLCLIRTRPVRFKEGVPASTSGIQLYAAGRQEDFPPGWPSATVEEPPLTIRAKDGTVHPEYQAVKVSFGFPP